MTYQATIKFNQTEVETFQKTNSPTQFLILHLDAPSPESAHQVIKKRWKKIKQQLPQISSPRLLQVSEIPVRCPCCGASEMSFCHH